MPSATEYVEPKFFSRLINPGVKIVYGAPQSGKSLLIQKVDQRLRGVAFSICISLDSSTGPVLETVWRGLLDQVVKEVSMRLDRLEHVDEFGAMVVARLLKAALGADYTEYLLRLARQSTEAYEKLRRVEQPAATYNPARVMPALGDVAETLISAGDAVVQDGAVLAHVLVDVADTFDWQKRGDELARFLGNRDALHGAGYACTACVSPAGYVALQTHMKPHELDDALWCELVWQAADFLPGVRAQLIKRNQTLPLEQLLDVECLALISPGGQLSHFVPALPNYWCAFGNLLADRRTDKPLAGSEFFMLFKEYCRRTQPLTIGPSGVWVGPRKVELPRLHAEILALLVNPPTRRSAIGAEQLSHWLRSQPRYSRSGSSSVNKAIAEIRDNPEIEPIYRFRPSKAKRDRTSTQYCTYLLNEGGYYLYGHGDAQIPGSAGADAKR